MAIPAAARATVAARTPVLLLAALLLCAAGPAEAASRVAVIGDFGDGSSREQAVAALVKGWDAAARLDAVVTVGDNTYPVGSTTTLQSYVGAYYSWAITPDPATNRFWPCPGNHDWGNACPNGAGLEPYRGFFTALGRKSVYDVRIGPDLHFFMLDSDCNEPMGRTASSQQAAWLRGQLAASSAPIKVVVLHHPPYTSGSHGNTADTQWPFEEWGAHAVLTGHDHTYERLDNPRNVAGKAGFPYIVNGIGGASIYTFNTPLASSKVRYNASPGAQLLTTRSSPVGTGGDTSYTSTQYELDLKMLATTGAEVDCWRIVRLVNTSAAGGTVIGAATRYEACSGGGGGGGSSADFSLLTHKAPVAGQQLAQWRYLNGGTAAAPDAWTALSFDDAPWPSGASPLGYGGTSWTGGWATTVPSNSAIATGATAWYYFRLKLCIPQDVLTKLQASQLSLRVLADNGADVYVNGAPALSQSTANHNPAYWNDQAPLSPSALVAGTNIIAARVSNTATSSDTGFDLDIVYTSATGTAFSTTPAVPCGAPQPPPPASFSLLTHKAPVTGKQLTQWRYLNGGTAPAPSLWTAVDFDDTPWPSGASPLGYGGTAAWAGGYATTVPSNSAIAVNTIAYYYFRLRVCIPQDVLTKLQASQLSLRVLADNGADVYVNGAPALSDSAANHDPLYWNDQAPLSPSALVAGTNVIAARVSNNRGSGDTGFDLDIVYTSADGTAFSAVAAVPCAWTPPPKPVYNYSLITHKEAVAGRQLTQWRFLKGGTAAAPPRWTAVDFDDAPWPSGASPLGYGGTSWTGGWATTVPSNSAIATGATAWYYFRLKLCIPQDVLTQLQSLAVSLRVLADNGADVYVNGVAALADSTADHNPSYWNDQVAFKPSLLVPGTNIIAARISNTAGSSDTGFDMDIVYTNPAAAPLSNSPSAPCLSAPQQSVPATYSLFSQKPQPSQAPQGPAARYKFLASPSDLAPVTADSWVTLTYADGSWGAGASPIGYGPGLAWGTAVADNAKALRAGSTAYYYHRTLLCLPPDVATQLSAPSTAPTLRLAANDAARVYINTALVLDSTATAPANGAPLSYWNAQTPLPAGLLVAGPNVIAVQVPNKAASPESGFDLDLTYSSAAPLAGAETAPCLPSSLVPKSFSLFTHAAPADANPAKGPAATWRWLNGLKTQLPVTGTASWTAASYPAASAWQSGSSPLGYGAPPAAGVAWGTLIEPNGNITTGRAYYYFRTSLCLTPAVVSQLRYATLTLRVLSNNGARVFINGASVWDDLTATHAARYWNTAKVLAPGTLVAGPNTIAVQVSNSPRSTGAGFDLDLTYGAVAPFGAAPSVCS